MFICRTCIKRYEGSAIDWATAMGRMSLGNCELCEAGQRLCYDIPSGADWHPKKKPAASEGKKKPN